MKTIRQISIFSENKPGKLEKITRVLSENNINIRAITIASTEKFGVIKFLVDQYDLAFDILTKQGFTCAENEIFAVEINDEPGGLHKLALALARNKINIENASGFVIEAHKKSVMLIEVSDIEGSKKVLEKEPFRLLSQEEILK